MSEAAYSTILTTIVDTLTPSRAIGTLSKLPIQNELLCFVQQKCHVFALYQLATLCTDSYRSDEVIAAVSS